MKKILFLLLLLPVFVKGQIITTIAGIGMMGFAGDGTSATLAKLNTPGGAVFDKAGNLYIADAANNRIRKISTSGIISTFAGTGSAGYSGDGGSATNAMLNDPADLTIDTAGNLYVTDLFNLRVRIISSAGIINTYAGNGIPGYSGDGGQATAARIGNPSGIAIDEIGNIYIAGSYTLREVTPTGIISTIAGNGGSGYSGDGGPATAALIGPSGVTVDAAGNIFIADNSNNRVRKINTLGIITTIAGNGIDGYVGDGSLATTAELQPYDVDIDKFGNLFISDYANNVIRIVNLAGYIYTIAGNNIQGYSGDGGPSTTAELYGPYHITLDTCNNLYICDGHNDRVRKVTYPHCDYLKAGSEVLNNKLSIYPNPTNDVLHIDNIKLNTTCCLTNIIGATMLQGVLSEGNNSISVQSLSPGMYLLELVGEDGRRVVKVVRE